MNKKLLSKIGIAFCCILIALTIFLFFNTDGEDANKVKVFFIGVIVWLLHCCYRISVHSKTEGKDQEVISDHKILQARTFKEFLCDYFNPKEMRFRTSFSFLILLALLTLRNKLGLFIIFLVLLLISKTILFIQYYRYWKLYNKALNDDIEDTENDREIDEEKVKKITDEIISKGINGIKINFKPKDESAISIGCSKYGGQPDVPEEFVWPRDDQERPLSLLLQINCSDLTVYDSEKLLPTTGRLYFFYELSEQNWEGTEHSVKVIYDNTDHNNLQKIEFPEDLSEEYRLNERELIFNSEKSYMSFEEFMYRNTYSDISDDEIDEITERVDDEKSYDKIGNMLGFADFIQGIITEDFDNNILLLQMNSLEDEDDEELMFGDCGAIYFYISREDLKLKNFENIKFEMQCY
ncbi:MAG: DUF1963 domain-containing protein [Bacteroidaceae bacterium]|nr:DUF1963 domain-containing protein [Bacteroidaceae bacterium]